MLKVRLFAKKLRQKANRKKITNNKSQTHSYYKTNKTTNKVSLN